MKEAITDSDLEQISRLGVPVSVIIENIENGKGSSGVERNFIESNGDKVTLNINGAKKVFDKLYALSALKELEKTLLQSDPTPKSDAIDYSKYIHYKTKAKLTYEDVLMYGSFQNAVRDYYIPCDSCDEQRKHESPNNAGEIHLQNDLIKTSEDPPSCGAISSTPESQIDDSNLNRTQKHSVLYHPFFYFSISLVIAYLAPFGILHTVFVPIAIMQAVAISLSCYFAFRSSSTSIDIEDQMLPVFYKQRAKMAKYFIPVLLPLLSVWISYSIMTDKISRELHANGTTTMAAISKVYQQERGNGEIVRIRLDFSFKDLNGRIVEATKNFPGSKTQYLKCMNASLIKVTYSPDYPEIFEVIPPCIGGRL